jgi:hypothetical protein
VLRGLLKMAKVRNTINGHGRIARVTVDTDEERDILNKELRRIRSFGGKVTPNSLLKRLSMEKAEEDLNNESV